MRLPARRRKTRERQSEHRFLYGQSRIPFYAIGLRASRLSNFRISRFVFYSVFTAPFDTTPADRA
jgi:hypothetical protein